MTEANCSRISPSQSAILRSVPVEEVSSFLLALAQQPATINFLREIGAVDVLLLVSRFAKDANDRVKATVALMNTTQSALRTTHTLQQQVSNAVEDVDRKRTTLSSELSDYFTQLEAATSEAKKKKKERDEIKKIKTTHEETRKLLGEGPISNSQVREIMREPRHQLQSLSSSMVSDLLSLPPSMSFSSHLKFENRDATRTTVSVSQNRKEEKREAAPVGTRDTKLIPTGSLQTSNNNTANPNRPNRPLAPSGSVPSLPSLAAPGRQSSKPKL
eukprot:GDKJ01039216.1.p1 GENE.GDKJ01039216.1~~GDKJ01039216.1.p1  ORF type:complete len:273 (-),score=89.71 GDKJ01039216.1:96-914(-)